MQQAPIREEKDRDVSRLLVSSDNRWWLPALEKRRAAAIFDTARRLWLQSEDQRHNMYNAWRLYSSQPITGLSPKLYRTRQPSGRSSRLSLNCVKAVVDSYVALLTKDRPKVSFVTSGGDGSLHRKAMQLEQFIDGIFYDADLYDWLPQLALDSSLWPMGAVKIYSDEGDPDSPHIRIERTFPWEWLADEQESTWGDPKTLYQVRYIDRLALMEEYADDEAIVGRIATDAPTAASFDTNMTPSDGEALTDLVVVIEAWHLPRRAGDIGRHTIATGDILLHDEDWRRPRAPVEFLYRLRPTVGIWGGSLADELAAIQREINVLLDKIRRSHHLLGGAHWLVEQSSQVNSNMINNDIGSIIRYRGIMPQVVAPQAVSADVYQHLDRLWSRAFEVIGISQMAAQSQMPAALAAGSGKAILAYADVQSQRFQPCYRELQNFVLRLARQVIATARDIEERIPSFEVRSAGKGTMVTVKWADAKLRDEEFQMQMKATNKLADDPVGVMRQIQDFANAGPGWMSPTDARRLMTEIPDLAGWASLQNAPYDQIMIICDQMLNEGKYTAPDAFMPLDKANPDNALKWVHQRYTAAVINGYEEDRLELLRRWLTDAKAVQDEMNPPPPPAPPGAPPGGPGAPPGMPGAPPGSAGQGPQMPPPPPVSMAA